MKPLRPKPPHTSKHRRLSVEDLEQRWAPASTPLSVLSGDWNGDRADSVGFYSPDTRQFLLSDANSSGFATTVLTFGGAQPTWRAVVGDWDGNGTDTAGVYDPTTGIVQLRNRNMSGRRELAFQSGVVNAQPIAGDWDGDGKDSLALFDSATGQFHVFNSFQAGAVADVLQLGVPGPNWTALAGDWDGDGRDSLGLVDVASGQVLLNHSLSTAAIDQVLAISPHAGSVPLVGDWNANGLDTFGFHEQATQLNRLSNAADASSLGEAFYVVPAAATPVVAKKTTPISLAASSGLAGITLVNQLSAPEVEQLLQRAAAASASQDAIIAIVDRGGHILGVRVEQGVLDTIADDATLVFAIDGAVAKARTAAFFANGDPDNEAKGTVGPLTSRTIRFISQTTIAQREVESNPNVLDLDSTLRGPGFVAPIGLGGHFPPEVAHTPPVDLFAIEHTNRDSLVNSGPDGLRSDVDVDANGAAVGANGDDILLASRFNASPAFIPAGQEIDPPESYGLVSDRLSYAQSRGIATLPGGLPIYRIVSPTKAALIGGIGVFFPGSDGYATHEQGFVAGIGQTEAERTNAPRVLEAEWIAYAALGGAPGARSFVKTETAVGTLDGVAPIADIALPFGRIDLVGITLEIYGPGNPIQGIKALLNKGREVVAGAAGSSTSGDDQRVLPGGTLYLAGQAVPDGWLVLPHGSGSIATADVQQIVTQGVAEANKVRAAIRLKPGKPLPTAGARTRMVLSVADTDGNVLGLFRMQDATFFSIDVAVAKARNVAYYADAAALQPADMIDDTPLDGIPDVPAGVAFTNRTFRFLAEPRFPSGVEGSVPGAFSILLDPGVNRTNAENLGPAQPASAFNTVLGFDAFNPGRNFRDPDTLANQSGIVFFPGSSPLYVSAALAGGFGVSGDGVDQDDVVTFFGQKGFQTPLSVLRADQVFVRGVRLPYQKFNRNPQK